jgi:hypothetical protein
MPRMAIRWDKEVPMFLLIWLGVGLALIALAALYALNDLPDIQVVPNPWTPLPLSMISGYPGKRRE